MRNEEDERLCSCEFAFLILFLFDEKLGLEERRCTEEKIYFDSKILLKEKMNFGDSIRIKNLLKLGCKLN